MSNAITPRRLEPSVVLSNVDECTGAVALRACLVLVEGVVLAGADIDLSAVDGGWGLRGRSSRRGSGWRRRSRRGRCVFIPWGPAPQSPCRRCLFLGRRGRHWGWSRGRARSRRLCGCCGFPRSLRGRHVGWRRLWGGLSGRPAQSAVRLPYSHPLVAVNSAVSRSESPCLVVRLLLVSPLPKDPDFKVVVSRRGMLRRLVVDPHDGPALPLNVRFFP